MKHAIIAFLFLANPLTTWAQKHYLYADVGLSLAYLNPGLSATYNYKVGKHFGIGAGAQAYVFHATITNTHQFTPALFADARFLIRPKHKSQYFILADLGIDFYKHSEDYLRDGNYVYSAPKDNGTYFGLALGYFRRTTARGWGPYASLKLITNFCKEDQLHLTTGEQKSLSVGRGTFVVSVGFRFGDEAKKAEAKKKTADH